MYFIGKGDIKMINTKLMSNETLQKYLTEQGVNLEKQTKERSLFESKKILEENPNLKKAYSLYLIKEQIDKSEEMKQLFKRFLFEKDFTKGSYKKLVNKTFGIDSIMERLELEQFEHWLKEFDLQNLYMAKFILENGLLDPEQPILEVCTSEKHNVTKHLKILTNNEGFQNVETLVSGAGQFYDILREKYNPRIKEVTPETTILGLGIYKDINELTISELRTGKLMIGSIYDSNNKDEKIRTNQYMEKIIIRQLTGLRVETYKLYNHIDEDGKHLTLLKTEPRKRK